MKEQIRGKEHDKYAYPKAAIASQARQCSTERQEVIEIGHDVTQ